ncbi:MAG: cytochrome c family protein, partial [Tistlia sp.]
MSLEVNKIAAAGLTAGVVAMLAGFAADLLVHSPSLEQDAYPIVVASSGGEGEAEPAPSGPESVLPLLAQADPANGERLVRACQACHSFDKNGANKVGPNLYAVVGAELGHLEDFAYSNAMVERREAGDTWTYENLNHFLENPRDWLPGTKMAYAGMGKVESRADVIAYLRGQADAEAPLPSQEEIEAVQPEGEAAEAEVLPAAGSESADAGEEQAAPAAADDQQAAAPAAEGGEQ